MLKAVRGCSAAGVCCGQLWRHCTCRLTIPRRVALLIGAAPTVRVARAHWRSCALTRCAVGFARTALPWAAFPRGALDARHLSAAAAPPPAEEPSPSVQAQPVADAKDGSPASEQSPTQYVGPLAVTLRRVKVRAPRAAAAHGSV